MPYNGAHDFSRRQVPDHDLPDKDLLDEDHHD
jgi:hypothetical protein